ncbi:head protein [Veronia nyctiphanis]|uniref:Head protein n=1 Tax=Veronia nyctiphanis TaxID=1278244 RepID=A0A4Q0YNC4_9GAMM|nr:head completion/stabilization protein [Veronia nyctiphanis]RXJ70641.1 head protein [Veronia nyctiphanis]
MMSGFIATNSPNKVSDTVKNNGFFPDVDISDFRATMRVDQTIHTANLKHNLTLAMTAVNQELADWQHSQQKNTLAEVISESYGTHSRVEFLYRAALFNKTKSALLENYRDFDSTKSGHEKADEMKARIDDHLRLSREAIRLLLGISKVTVELI